MLNQRGIRRKIRTTKNLQKIFQAMKMVAAARLKRVQDRVAASRPYSEKMHELVNAVAPYAHTVTHPLLEVRPPKKIGMVVLTGEKGLCGGFNNSIIRVAAKAAGEFGDTPVELITIGRKGNEHFKRRNYSIAKTVALPSVNAPYSVYKSIVDTIAEWYTSGAVDEVHIAFTVFVSTMTQRPSIIKVLPIEPPKASAGDGAKATEQKDYIFEPPAPQLLAELLPRYLENQIYHKILEAMASEQGARMTSMTAATDNAGELIETLSLAYNKARQFAITKELLEIVSGAEALRQAN